jgi:serine/threonine protein kinase
MTTFASETSGEFTRFSTALDGQYALECEIGRGGMGIVYRAHDLRLDRRVAIKTLPRHLADDTGVRERFLREARTVARLSHPNIVPIHRADEIRGHVFFVMGYVDGQSLAQHIRDRRRIDPRVVLRQLRDVAGALAYAHRAGVIHRDVKAENILIDDVTGRAMVTDFGIARLAEAAPLTATGQVLGTVYYLSPEQVSGDPVDGRSDIYALGVVGFLALAGRFPFDAELASAVLIAHVNKSPPPLHSVAPHVPRALCDVIDRCLAKDPSARFQSGDELSARLSSIEGEVERETPERATGASPAESPLISDTEVQAIIGRAADLQVMTGIQQSPTIPGSRDATRDAERTSGHRAGNVRDAAIEAGIAAKYVDRALVEHGLTPSPLPAPPTDHSPSGGYFVGSPTRVEYELFVDGEMPERDYDLLVEVLRETTGESGQITTIGRAFSWQSDPRKGTLHVSVLPRGGKTRIRVSETLRVSATALFGGLTGAIGGGSLPIWLGLGLKMGDFGAGMLLWGGTILLSYLGARGLFAQHSRVHSNSAKALIERLAAEAREAIDAATPGLGREDGR